MDADQLRTLDARFDTLEKAIARGDKDEALSLLSGLRVAALECAHEARTNQSLLRAALEMADSGSAEHGGSGPGNSGNTRGGSTGGVSSGGVGGVNKRDGGRVMTVPHGGFCPHKLTREPGPSCAECGLEITNDGAIELLDGRPWCNACLSAKG